MSLVPSTQLWNITASPLLGLIETPTSGKSVSPPSSTSFRYARAVNNLWPPGNQLFLPSSVFLSNASKCGILKIL